MRVLVTGGGGFLGKALVYKLLSEGHEVRATGRRKQSELESMGVEVWQADLADEEKMVDACRDRDAVFHVAAKAGIWGCAQAYESPNVLGTRHILKGCRVHGVSQLVYTSTPSVVFSRDSIRSGDESLPYATNWLCHYPRTKAIAEQEVLAAHQPDHLYTTALRPHLIWGPGDPHLLPRIIKKARAGRLAQVGDGDNRVDITHVDNAAEAHILAWRALQRGQGGGRAFFVSDGTPVVLWDWINRVLEHHGVPPLQKQLSIGKAYAIGSVCEFVWKLFCLSGEPPMTRFVALQLGKDHTFDISAARSTFDYCPKEYPLPDTTLAP